MNIEKSKNEIENEKKIKIEEETNKLKLKKFNSMIEEKEKGCEELAKEIDKLSKRKKEL